MSNPKSFEDLPDEILLLICGYLTQVTILDGFLNLNERLNKTIASYRQKIFLSHLSFKEFHRLLNDHLIHLAPHVNHLYLNNCSMLNAGKLFEKKFNQIDQQFPLLQELRFQQIDIETLENLSWRFNTMTHLQQLTIDITEDRLGAMPVQFDEFLCGKLFSQSNSFAKLTLNLNKYHFNLHSLTQRCENLRELTISVRQLSDLLILFDHLPNLEQLIITMSCSSNPVTDTYLYEQLWWKVAYLTKFSLTIEEKQLSSHDYVLSHEIIFKIIRNLYSLLDFRLQMDIKFNSILQFTTTKEIYANKYLPYIDGSLWEQALRRNDHRMITFQFHIELDGYANNYLRLMNERADDVDFKSLIKRTFFSTYWLQKNTIVECRTSPFRHVSIYSLPMLRSRRSTTVEIIDQEISVEPSLKGTEIQELTILSNSSTVNLSLINLFKTFPCLTHLTMDTVLLLPPNPMICSSHLRFLSLSNYSLASCCELLEFLPQVISLSISNSSCERLGVDACLRSSRSITRLRLIIDSFSTNNFSQIKNHFPFVREFYFTIKNMIYGSMDDYRQYEKFDDLSNDFTHLQYMELCLPIKQSFLFMFESDRICHIRTSDGHYLITKRWIEK